jgi:3-hydroxyisobutyrate dehydrogenase
MTPSNSSVGLIGVGLMGHGIALNILKAGYALTILDHPGNQPIDDLLKLGVKVAQTPSQIAQSCNVIVLCVTGTPQVEDVLYRPDGVLAKLQPDTVIIDCSTAIPASTVKVASDVHAAGGQFLDAPMTRTPKEAAQGRLNLIVGGDAALFDACMPLFKSYAENVVYAGPVGAGHQMKLIHNFVSLGMAAIVSEAAACAQLSGLDPDMLVQVLGTGGGKGVVLDRLVPYIREKDASGFMFSTANALKDMTYYTAMADQAGIPHKAAEAVRVLYEQASANPEASTAPTLIDVLVQQGQT